jgi:hypothetical protein
MGHNRISNGTAMVRHDRNRGAGLIHLGTRAAILTSLCIGLSACGVSQLTSPFQRGLFGGGDGEKKEEQQAAVATPATLAQNQQGGEVLTTGSIGCPVFDVANGERTITFHAPGAAADNLAVMHRGEITNTARECNPSANGLTVKYGFEGRVLLGPRGKAGSITLPAKVTIVDGSKATVKTQNVRVVVNVPAGSTSGFFSEVRDLELPVSQGGSPKSYRIYVGFDRAASGAS